MSARIHGVRDRLMRGVVVVITLTAVGALCHVWIHLRILHLGYALAEETRRLEQAEETSRRLNAEIAYLKSHERLEKLARDQLHMVPLDPGAIHVVPAPRLARASIDDAGGAP